MEAELISVQNVISDMSIDSMANIAQIQNLRVKVKPRMDEKRVQRAFLRSIVQDCYEEGVKELCNSLPKQLLLQLSEQLSDDHLFMNITNENKKQREKLSKPILAKRVREKIIEIKPNVFLEGVETDVLVDLLDFFGVEPESKKRKYLVQEVIVEFESQILSAYLSLFDVPTLTKIAKESHLTVESKSKMNIIESIISGENCLPEKRKQTKVSKKKPEIDEDINVTDLRAWYSGEELRTFCEDNGLKVSGTKVELAQRIVGFFDPDKENETPQLWLEKRARKREEKEEKLKEKKMKERKSKKKSKRNNTKKSTKPLKEKKKGRRVKTVSESVSESISEDFESAGSEESPEVSEDFENASSSSSSTEEVREVRKKLKNTRISNRRRR